MIEILIDNPQGTNEINSVMSYKAGSFYLNNNVMCTQCTKNTGYLRIVHAINCMSYLLNQFHLHVSMLTVLDMCQKGI